MNIKELLNTDLETAGSWLRVGFHWWLDELRQIVPQRWQQSVQRRRQLVAEFDGARLRVHDEDPSDAARTPTKRKADIVLAPSQVLTRVLDLPLMRMADVIKMIQFELDRLTPFRESHAFFDVEVLQRDEESGTQTVRLGVLPKTNAENLQRVLADELIQPLSMRVSGPVPGSLGRLNFQPAVRAAQGRGQAGRRAQIFWIVAVALLLANLAFMIMRDSKQLNDLRDISASQSSVVTLARHLRASVDKEAAAREALMDRRAASSPLQMLNTVTVTLPHTAWIQRFSWDTKQLQLNGYGAKGQDIAAALVKTSRLHGAKIVRATSGSSGQFMVVLEVRRKSP
ncbi:MAG TPA: hypothetical protein VGG10_13825 [Rhizomicrobium sp.]